MQGQEETGVYSKDTNIKQLSINIKALVALHSGQNKQVIMISKNLGTEYSGSQSWQRKKLIRPKPLRHQNKVIKIIKTVK